MTARQKENRKPKLTAEAAYENAHLVAQDQLERIRELLFDLPAPGDEEHPINWSHVGSISHVNAKLAELIAFLDGTPPPPYAQGERTMTTITRDQEPDFTPCTIEIVATADLIGSGEGSRMCVMDDEGSTYAAATVGSRRQARRQIQAWAYEFPIVIADAYRRIDEHFAKIAAR